MVLFQIDPHRVVTVPLERETPRSIHVDGVALGFSLKLVEVKSRDVHVIRFAGGMQGIESTFQTRNKIGINLGCIRTMP